MLLGAIAPLLAGAAVELALELAAAASGAFVASAEEEALGAGAVGAGDALAAGVDAGGVLAVVDFWSLHADTASVSAAATISDLYMVGFPSGE